ncbi:hypothetical protein [Variovorax gossypii]
MATERKRPVKLQVNTNGAWKDLVRFDAGIDVMAAEAMDAAERLGQVDSSVSFRLVIDDGSATTLYRWTNELGWKEVTHG